tara:strand:- start:119 stop:241 length:123 start_codon:yes stop_codon:yes gene_type:complete
MMNLICDIQFWLYKLTGYGTLPNYPNPTGWEPTPIEDFDF